MKRLYPLMALISAYVRLVYVPNPFLCFGKTSAIFFNLIAAPILYAFTFTVVGLFYSKGSFPALGSFLYLFFYFIHVVLLMLMGVFHFVWLATVPIVILYVIALIGIKLFSFKLGGVY